MDLRQLKYFMAIAEEGQITRAAKRLHMTQPPLSQQMILLESELGVNLFERTKKNIRLTEAGTLLYQKAEELMEMADQAVDQVRELGSGRRGLLGIGTITSSGRSLIPEYIRQFHKEYPLISFDLHHGTSQRILQMLDAGIIEIGLVRLPVNTAHYHHILLPPEEIVLAYLPDLLPHDRKTPVPLELLRDRPLLIARKYQESLLAACRSSSFEPDLFCISDDIASLMVLAASGLGLALVPESALHTILNPSVLRISKLKGEPLQTTGAIIWRKKHALSAAATHFLETCFPQFKP